MLTMTNPLTVMGFTVYQDDAAEVLAAGGPAGSDAAGVRRFYVLPEKPDIAMENGKPIFSLIVYRRDEERIDPAKTADDVGGGILTFTVELAIPPATFDQIKAKLKAMLSLDTDDSSLVVTYVPFLDGKVSVAVAGESGTEGAGAEFVKGMVGTGKVSGVGENRKAVMVKLSQEGAALMSQIEKLNTLPINVQYELSFEHRLLGVTMRVWCDLESSYTLTQTVLHTTDDYSDGYLGMSSNHVNTDKVTSVVEVLERSKVAGVQVIPQTSQIDADTLASLEKFGLEMLNKEMENAVQASPPPKEVDRTYLTSFIETYGTSLNFTLDRRMVLVKNFTPSANISNVFQQGNLKEMVAFVDLRTAFFAFLKVPIRVNADFSKLPLDSVTVTVVYERERVGGGGHEERVDSFNFTDGSAIQTFLAYSNSLAELTYDWSAIVHYKGSNETYTLSRTAVKDNFLVVDVGSLGMLAVDLGLGLVDVDRFPQARVSLRYASQALGRTLEQSFLFNKDKSSALWTEVIHEEPKAGFEYKVDWLRKEGGDILEGEWTRSTSSRLRFDAPIPDQLAVTVVCSGNFKDGGDQISEVAVGLRYHDEDNHYTEEGRLVFTDDKQQQTWTVDLRNRELRSYQYKYTIIYKDGVVKSFPETGEWLTGDPGFITVGEKYTLEVEVFPSLLAYGDNAKLAQVNLTYDDAPNNIHVVDSFVFNKENNAPRTWRVRGVAGGPRRYTAEVLYFSAAGVPVTVSLGAREAEVLVIPPPPPAPPPASPAPASPSPS